MVGFMPLLRSLVGHVARMATNMTLLTELVPATTNAGPAFGAGGTNITFSLTGRFVTPLWPCFSCCARRAGRCPPPGLKLASDNHVAHE